MKKIILIILLTINLFAIDKMKEADNCNVIDEIKYIKEKIYKYECNATNNKENEIIKIKEILKNEEKLTIYDKKRLEIFFKNFKSKRFLKNDFITFSYNYQNFICDLDKEELKNFFIIINSKENKKYKENGFSSFTNKIYSILDSAEIIKDFNSIESLDVDYFIEKHILSDFFILNENKKTEKLLKFIYLNDFKDAKKLLKENKIIKDFNFFCKNIKKGSLF